MTTRLRARVRRRFEPHHDHIDRYMQPWLASISINGRTQWHLLTAAGSQPEAMQMAYKLLRDLEQQLMDEVHASRASRREAKK